MNTELVIDEGKQSSYVLRNIPKRLVIGRAKHCDIIFRDDPPQVANCHCIIYCIDNNLFLLDDFSTHRTFLNGECIKPGEKILLQTNDVILLGEHTIRIS